MTHSVTLEIPDEIYMPIADQAEATGRKFEEIALEKLAKDESIDDTEFERLADELADYVEASLPPDAKPLSDYAISREGLYDDHL